jgi:hypothetical protein
VNRKGNGCIRRYLRGDPGSIVRAGVALHANGWRDPVPGVVGIRTLVACSEQSGRPEDGLPVVVRDPGINRPELGVSGRTRQERDLCRPVRRDPPPVRSDQFEGAEATSRQVNRWSLRFHRHSRHAVRINHHPIA